MPQVVFGLKLGHFQDIGQRIQSLAARHFS